MEKRQKGKLICCAAAGILLAGLLWFGERGKQQETGGEQARLLTERFACYNGVLTEDDFPDGQAPLTYQELSGFAGCLAERGLLRKPALLLLEQEMARRQETEPQPTKELVQWLYRLCAEYSERTELLARLDLFVFGEKGVPVGEKTVQTSCGSMQRSEAVSLLYGTGYSVITEGTVITELLGYAEQEIVLKNVWLLSSQPDKIRIFYEGLETELLLEQQLSVTLEQTVADLSLSSEYVTEIRVKQDIIRAKVLRTAADGVELEGYGTLKFEDGFKIYKIYDGIEQEQAAGILVGYTLTSFAMNGDKISAALITEPLKATNIRVLIRNSSYQGYYHESVELTSESRFYISTGAGALTWYEPGSCVTLSAGLLTQGERIYAGTERENGTLCVRNLKRMTGAPAYRGTLELSLLSEGMVLINEVSMEEYLYGVLPSEMPESFGTEALKAQAVCARSYAYHQLVQNRFRQYGAHVDDSVASQVYMNQGENEAATFAVKDTFGRILTYGGECIRAYYFSCSYGHTSDAEDVWEAERGETYLKGSSQQIGLEGKRESLSDEEAFRRFFEKEENCLDRDAVWFRWSTELGEEFGTLVEARLKKRYGSGAQIGTLKSMEILERAESGLVTKLALNGSSGSFVVSTEYEIRLILAPTGAVVLADGSTSRGMSLLPSGYFLLEQAGEQYRLTGGGYGHGVGMSQYGAKKMTSLGYRYEAILQHYYPGTTLTYLYR